MKILQVPVVDLSHDPANARKHPERNLDTIVASLRRFGQQKPIVIDRNNIVRAGNGTLEAAKRLGWEKIDCVRTELNGADATAYAIADNRTAELAEWDDEILAATLNGLALEEGLLEAAGYDEEELAAMLAEIDDAAVGEVTEDEVPEPPEEPITKPGDLWILGRHRVLCGDSTKAEDVARLMDGANIDILFTSPPYSDQRSYDGASDLSPEKLSAFITQSQPYADLVCVNLGMKRDRGVVVRYWDDYISAAESCGLGLLSWNVWDRSGFGYTIGQATAIFTIDHEFVFVFGRESRTLNKTVPNKTAGRKTEGTRRQADGSTTPAESTTSKLRQLGTVFRCDVVKSRDKELDKHPAMFPVAFPAAYIAACCSDGGNVYEPFCGSGTTLIAAEQLGRTCYGMEISPAYCDVIVKRWETLTGQKATCQRPTRD
jgi:DNA modification methylase